ncbi:MAG: PH domain-containing protein, partial [bacterium]|nr:PH domain-containing protein [bacterium]
MSATMKQAIAGVAPAGLNEVTVMTVLPSTSYYAPIRWLGSLMAINAGVYIFRVGNLIALASIPLAIPFFFLRFLPFS